MTDPLDERDEPSVPEMDRQSRNALPIANAVRRSVAQIARRLRALRPDAEISGAKLSLLGRLHRANAPLIAAEIARLERLQPQSLTRIIAELDEKGLIRRRQDDFDRRQILIELTPNGQRHLVRNAIHANVWLAETMATRLTEAERQMLNIAAGLLMRLAEEDAVSNKEAATKPDKIV